MDKEKKIEKLRSYIVTLGKLRRRCGEAELWDDLALGGGGSILRAGSGGDPDTVKETAVSIRQECEALAVKANGQRQKLAAALALMPSDQLREILERKYLLGVSSAQLQQEYKYSKRTVNRLISSAVLELERCSKFFEH